MARYMFFFNPKYVSLWICQYESQSYIFVYDATALCPLGIMQTCIKSQHNIDEFLWQLNLACLTDEIFCSGFLLCLIVFCLKSIERKKLVWYLLWWEYWAYTLKALCTCKMSLKWRFFFINPKQHSCHDEDLHRNCFHLFVCAAQLRSLVLEMQRFNGSNRANWSVFDSWCVLRLTDYNNQRLRSVSGCVRLYNLIP